MWLHSVQLIAKNRAFYNENNNNKKENNKKNIQPGQVSTKIHKYFLIFFKLSRQTFRRNFLEIT